MGKFLFYGYCWVFNIVVKQFIDFAANFIAIDSIVILMLGVLIAKCIECFADIPANLNFSMTFMIWLVREAQAIT